MSNYFKPEEFKCKCGTCDSTGHEMDADFIKYLDDLRGKCNFPFVITSGYRCPAHNNTVSTTGFKGPHTTGKAVDISVDGHQGYILLDNIFNQGKFKRVGLNRKKGSGFIHIDGLQEIDGFPIEIVWTY